jgi:hypothetical protein
MFGTPSKNYLNSSSDELGMFFWINNEMMTNQVDEIGANFLEHSSFTSSPRSGRNTPINYQSGNYVPIGNMSETVSLLK